MEKFNEMVEGEIPVLVDFYASWCGPCKMMHPILEELKEKVGDKAKIIKIDTDKPSNQSLVESFQIRSIPTLIVFRDGEAVWRMSGVQPVEQLLEALGV